LVDAVSICTMADDGFGFLGKASEGGQSAEGKNGTGKGASLHVF